MRSSLTPRPLCTDKGARNDARPERKEAKRRHMAEHGVRYSREYRKRKLQEDPAAYRANNAKRMREYVERNADRIATWRSEYPGGSAARCGQADRRVNVTDEMRAKDCIVADGPNSRQVCRYVPRYCAMQIVCSDRRIVVSLRELK